jgi:polyhydroxybutyrate depolymerase
MIVHFSAILSMLFLLSVSIDGCQTTKDLPGKNDITHTLDWQGYNRTYILHLPPVEKMQDPLPVLFHLHGGGGTAKGTPALTFERFNTLTDRDGFIVVYPNAIEKNWNDGRKSNLVTAWQENVDDVGFIVAIIDSLNAMYQIDKSRIFTTGMSNGGFMSTRLLCDRADLFRGGAILTAQISEDYLPGCNPVKPAAVLVMNGTDDPLVPYDGGEIKVFNRSRGTIISTDAYIEFWKQKNGCQTKKPTVFLPDTQKDGTTVSINEYTDCDERGSLILYRIEGGGHTWPGGKQYLGKRLIGTTSREIVACDVIWKYFKSL